MPERVHMNRIPGEERIHVEILAAEIPDLLADLARLHGPVSPATNQFVCLLDQAESQLADAVARSKEQH
jgi:hypothetical protein